jgi:hypothetical protein
MPASGLPHGSGRNAVMRELRLRTLSLAGSDGPDPLLEFRWPRHISFD